MYKTTGIGYGHRNMVENAFVVGIVVFVWTRDWCLRFLMLAMIVVLFAICAN
jgi:hypothetical protein